MALPPPSPPRAPSSAPSPTTIPRALLPILPLTLTTLAAFALAIRSGWTDLCGMWTRCSSTDTALLPTTTPLCFAVSIFQTPLVASRRARLEEAAIVGLLAGLAAVTSTEAEAARARAIGADRTHRGESGGERSGGGGHEKAAGQLKTGPGGSSNSSSRSNLSARIVENPVVPWLIYQLALGAFSWQGIIVPASIVEHHQHRLGSSQSTQLDSRPRIDSGSDSGSNAVAGDDQQEDTGSSSTLSITLSITIGLLLPSALMLALPTSTTAIVAWLMFPLWVSLIQQRLTPSTPTTRHRSTSSFLPHAIPILFWSAAAHALLLADLLQLIPPATDDSASPSPSSSSSSSSASAAATTARAAMLLLEVDHAALFATYLYWTHATSPSRRAGLRAAAVAVASALLLGPGAGVCLGWLARCRGGGGGGGGREVIEEETGRQQRAELRGGAVRLNSASSSSPRRTKGRRRATGTFFAGPDV